MNQWYHSGLLLLNNCSPHYSRKETKQFQSSPMSSIPCTPSWVSKIMSDTWCSSTVTVYIDTSRHKWIFWTSCHWARPIDMPSKLSKRLNKIRSGLGLGTPRIRSRLRASLTRRTKDKENMGNLMTTSRSHKQRRIMGR
jgi:hypothetical protein